MAEFTSIQAILQRGLAGSAAPKAFLNQMAALARQELRPQGLEQVYGTAIPKVLTSPWPVVLHLPGAGGLGMAPFTFGDGELGRPGGVTKYTLPVDIWIIVGHLNDDLGRMVATALDWIVPFDVLYSNNQTVGGACRRCTLRNARWEPFPYGTNPVKFYYALVLEAQALLYYQIPTHG